MGFQLSKWLGLNLSSQIGDFKSISKTNFPMLLTSTAVYCKDLLQDLYCFWHMLMTCTSLYIVTCSYTKRLLYSVPAQRYQRHWSNTRNFYSKVCDWFVDNKLSIHFGEDKTKSILFHTKRKLTIERSLDIRHPKIHIRQ